MFAASLQRAGLSENIFDLFGEWVDRSTAHVDFFYLKVHAGADLVGLGLLLRIQPFDLRTSYAKLRHNRLWSKLAGAVSTLSNNCVYLTYRNLITSNLARPFFSRTEEQAGDVTAAILEWLRERADADMVPIVDTAEFAEIYRRQRFRRYPSSSEAYLDATKYRDISEYLREHDSLRKNLARRKDRVQTEIVRGPVTATDRERVRACVECSAALSKVNNPCQSFFENNILDTEVFTSEKYLHIRIRVDGHVAGFHIFQLCGRHMGGVLGGFDRRYTKNNFVYERVIVASLDYAIQHGFDRVHYSLVDNHTKLRLVPSREQCALYFFSNSAMNRKIFDLAYNYGDVHDLSRLEAHETADAR